MLEEALYKKKSGEGACSEDEIMEVLNFMVSDVLQTISSCSYDRFCQALFFANKILELGNSLKDDENYQKNRKILEFLKKFNIIFKDGVDESLLSFSEKGAVAAAGNMQKLINLEENLGFEESMIILEAFRRMLYGIQIDRRFGECSSQYYRDLLFSIDRAIVNIYTAEMAICRKYDVFKEDFLRIISKDFNDSDTRFNDIMTCCGEDIRYGMSRILRPKRKIAKLTADQKENLYRAYVFLNGLGFRFSVIERFRLSLFLV